MSACLDLLHHIAHLNKVGVSHLASGCGGEALKAFKEALVIMRKATEHPDSEELFMSKVQTCSTQDINGLDSSFYLYNNAFLFEATAGLDIAFANAIVLFNLAIAFHQRGMSTGEEPKLRRALSLYDLSTQLISEVTPYSGALLMAALNNAAQIQFGLADYQGACETLAMLQSEATHLPLSECSPDILGEEHLDQIFLNVALTKPPTAAASA
jgi:hypothetical protein